MKPPWGGRHGPKLSAKCSKTFATTHLPFGGKRICFGGDFRQLPAVVPSGNHQEVYEASFINVGNPRFWDSMCVFRLTRPIRHTIDLPYSAMIRTVGNDTIIGDTDMKITLPLIDATTDINDAIDFALKKSSLILSWLKYGPSSAGRTMR